MKKSLKVLFIIISIIGLVSIFTNTSFAEFSYASEMTKDYITTDATGSAVSSTKTIMGTILLVMRTVAMGIAIIMLTYVAIKYMSAAPDEKAQFKKSAVAYIVGAVVLFGTSGILSIISNFATNIK